MTQVFTGVKTLLLDLDDTLWENNLYFLLSIESLCRVGRRYGMTDLAVNNLLDTLENRHIPYMGFGYASFEVSYLMTLKMILARAGAGADHPGHQLNARRMMHYLRTHPIDWLPGVLETLPGLREKYRLIIVTKGQPVDQLGKLDRSGGWHYFHGVEVVPRKSIACYEKVLSKYRLDAASTVMVGNSPHSDINQPKLAGLRTIYIPHPQTWHREMEPIRPDAPPTIEIPHFGMLPRVVRP
ncbi:MAG: HAD hydrolase-like protein [Candidatus Sumerlaeia bacterium]|nr:HAD hydrolase-like protein [Candidatus Sumerlaeia bacterium]